MDAILNNLLNINGAKCIAFIKEKNENIYHVYEGRLTKVGKVVSITVLPIANCSKKLISVYNNLIQSEIEYKNDKDILLFIMQFLLKIIVKSVFYVQMI